MILNIISIGQMTKKEEIIMRLEKIIEDAPNCVKKHFIYKEYPEGNIIINSSEENDSLYILLSGSAEVYKQNFEGAIVSLYIYNDFSFFGELEILNDNVFKYDIIAKKHCKILVISKNIFYEWIKTDVNFTLFLFEQLSLKLSNSSENVTKLALLTVKDRTLFSIFNHYKLDKLDQLTKQILVTEVSSSIRSVNRAINECIKEGFIIYTNKTFYIVSLEKLKNHIESIF